MKIIEKGRDRSVPTPPWWVGKTVRCKACGCMFELEAGDKVADMPQTSLSDRHHEMVCPNETCKAVLWFYKPEEYGTTDIFESLDKRLQSASERLSKKLEELERKTGVSKEGWLSIWGV